MSSESQVHFGDGLVLCAEEQPELVSGDVSGDLEALAGRDSHLLVKRDLSGQFERVLDPLLNEQVEMNLKGREVIILLLVV